MIHRMRIACQEGLLPGRDFAEKLDHAAQYGFDAVELNGHLLADDEKRAERRRALASGTLPACSVCGGVRARFIDIDPAERRASLESLRRQLAYAAEVGAPAQIFVPIFARDNHLPDLQPWKNRQELGLALFAEILPHIDQIARDAGVLAVMEPLNRYEANFLNRQEQAVGMVSALGSDPRVRILADFFHMHIEERDIPAAIAHSGHLLGHVHLADNTRKEPGSGFLDFTPGFKALAGVGYAGAMAFECGLTGPAAQVLPRSVQHLRDCLRAAGA